jgi:hypothetical protein
MGDTNNTPGDLANVAERVLRYAAHRTLRDLRLSIAAGRPLSLPNVLRLFQRRLSSLLAPVDLELAGPTRQTLRSLQQLYLEHQPFRHRPPRRGLFS